MDIRNWIKVIFDAKHLILEQNNDKGLKIVASSRTLRRGSMLGDPMPTL
jgi:hypothetical protein